MSSETTGLIALAISLLGTLVVSTWRFSSITAVLLESIKQLQKNDDEIKVQLRALEVIPRIETRLSFVESNYASVPKMANDIEVLKIDARHARELQRALLKSRTDNDTEPG